MNSRERLLTALQHQEPDRVPIDLDGMASTGIMAVAYNRLKAYLGLTGGEIKVYDIGQQLAHPEPPVLGRFGVDVLPLPRAPLDFDPAHPSWKPWRLPDGSPALVPSGFCPQQNERGDWLILDDEGRTIRRMPAGGLYFDRVYHPLAEATTVAEIEAFPLSDISEEELVWLRSEGHRLYETTDKAIMGHFGGSILEAAQDLRGWERFMTDLALEPKLAQALAQKLADHYVANLPRYLDAVGDVIHIIQMGDDMGTQRGPQMSPAMYRRMIKPYQRQVYEAVRACSRDRGRPCPYIFLHSCGSIYRLIPDLIEIGVDILNPVQISAAEMDPARLKREFGRDIVFWGGGADTQHVLPYARPEEVRQHVRELVEIFAPGGGYVFCAVHNIQANVPPQNVVAMFEAALEFVLR